MTQFQENPKEEWEEEYIKFFAKLLNKSFNEIQDKVKSFIRSHLQKAREQGRWEAVEEIIKLLEDILEWPEPKKGAGQGIGPLAGVGMYMQYDSDKKNHREQISGIIETLKAKLG